MSYVFILFISHAIATLKTVAKSKKVLVDREADFYTQVKDLLNPPSEQVFEPNFERMTIRQLRCHIRSQQLQSTVRDVLGKTVSNARKSELAQVLQAI